MAQDLETAVDCSPVEEDEDEDVNTRGDEHDDGSDVEEQVPMEKGGDMLKLHQKGKFIQDMTMNESRGHCGSFTPIWDIRVRKKWCVC